MKHDKRIRYLNIILNIALIAITFQFVFSFTLININIFNLILQIGFLTSYVMIIIRLKMILQLIAHKDPFNSENIINFKKIGYYVFIVGLIDAIINYPKPTNSNLEFLATSYGSLKPMFFIYTSLAILAFILSDVFKMAMEIKNENDLTV